MPVSFSDPTRTRPLVVESSIAAENTFTDTLEPKPGEFYRFSVSGTFVGTVTLQRKLKNQASFTDYATGVADTPFDGDGLQSGSGTIYQLGFKTGDYTSGTAECSIEWG